MPLKVLVIASAKPGKEHRLRELAAWVSGEIKAAEPHISEYEIYMADGDEAGTKDGVVIMQCVCSIAIPLCLVDCEILTHV